MGQGYVHDLAPDPAALSPDPDGVDFLITHWYSLQDPVDKAKIPSRMTTRTRRAKA